MASEDQDISVKVLESFWTQKHFDTYESRSDFPELFMKEIPSSPQLLNCISVMKNIYKKLLAKCCVGKKFYNCSNLGFCIYTFILKEVTQEMCQV